MKKTILISYAIVSLIYIAFTIVVLGMNGRNTPEIATFGLGKIFIILGALTMAGSYLALSVSFADILRFDFKKSKIKSWAYSIFPPLIIFLLLHLLNADSFIKVLGISGVVSGGLTAVLILMMVKKAKTLGDREPEYSIPYSKILAIILILIFLTGTILEIWHVF